MKETEHKASDLLMGMAAGAAVSAAGMMMMGNEPHPIKKTARKVARGAENAMLKVEKMVDDMMDR